MALKRTPRISIIDIAREMKLSPGTISKILNHTGNISEETRLKVLAYVKKMGYVANLHARSLKSQNSWTIGVIFSDISHVGLEHPFFAPILQAFKNYVEQFGYDIVFIVNKLGEQELTYVEWCRNKMVDGVLILTGNINNENIIDLVESEFPCVSTDIIMPNLYSLLSNDYQGIKDSVDYLLSTGLKRLGVFSGPQTSRAYFDRLMAYEQLMKEKQMPIDTTYIYVSDGYGYHHGYDGTKQWISQWGTAPEAILCFSDELSYGLIHALRDSGYRVPEDISVIGFDDNKYSQYFHPALTTVHQNKALIGQKAAQTLLSLMKDPSVELPQVQRIPVELIVRKSTK